MAWHVHPDQRKELNEVLDSAETARLHDGHDPGEVVTERIVREVPAAMPASSNAMRDERTPLPAPPRRRDTVVLTEMHRP